MCRKNPGIWSPCRNFKSTINERLTLKDAINDVDEIMYLVKQQLTITISKKNFVKIINIAILILNKIFSVDLLPNCRTENLINLLKGAKYGLQHTIKNNSFRKKQKWIRNNQYI